MTRTLPLRSALVVLFAFLAVAPAASARPDTAARLQMVWPASGTVTSHFGARGGRTHDGIDIGMLRSLRVRAAAAGVVRSTGYTPGYDGYGKIVLVDLPGPYVALYSHLAAVNVRRGQRVRQGRAVGRAGCTGSCSGTILHFEIRRAGQPVDPRRFLG